MLETYSDYIEEYFTRPKRERRPCPGEHHFVSAYLVPRLFKLNGQIPDYINPDGTKGIIGDVVYYKDKRHQFGIEVKLGTIRFTVNEFNDWVVDCRTSKWPQTFIGIAESGVAICSWRKLRSAYIASIKKTRGSSWKPKRISEGYGPMKSVNVLFEEISTEHYFAVSSEYKRSVLLERNFMQALRSEIDC